MNVYLITDLLHGKQYVGAEKIYHSKYFGSGRLIREAIEKFGKWNFKKEILIDDEYIDSWKECLALESACILMCDALQPNGYNITLWNWPIPVEMLSKGGKIGGKMVVERKIGLFDPVNEKKVRENRSKAGKIGGKRTKELGVGVHAPGMASKAGKIGGKIAGKKQAELKIGMFAPGMRDKKKENGRLV